MLKKLEKLEELLNKLIERVFTLISAIYYKLIPKILFVWWKRFVTKISTTAIRLNDTIQRNTKVALTHSNAKKQALDTRVNLIKDYPYKARIFAVVEFLKTILLKTPLKNHAQRISDVLKGKINSIDEVTDKVGKGQLAMGLLAFSIIAFGLVGVVNSTNKIVQAEFPDRAPASVQEYSKKPKYKKFTQRTIKVLNIKIPVSRDKVSDIRSVTVDFTVRTSTRFARKYLEHYEYKLKDYFFTNVEPVVSSFPIEDEGKDVFKEKIADDLDQFLRENNVEGIVEEVEITFLVAN